MACSDDQQPDFKHFCRICNKGFMCGRALGGHMRAHGVTEDETENLGDEDLATDCDGKKKTYALRTNRNRDFTRFCEHGKCSSDDGESSLVWSPESEEDDDGCGQHVGGGSGWCKRKRSSRVCASENEEDIALAKCLMALSNTRVALMEDNNLCTTTNKEEQRRNPIFSPVFLPSFSTPPPHLDKAKGVATTSTTTNPKGMFECKACKKVFNSHQALGGHRASHKNVKGCFAARNDQFDDNLPVEDIIIHGDYKPGTGSLPLAGRRSKVHKCTICNRIFASGQALGGHKRCHWLTSNYNPDNYIARLNFHEHIEQLHQRALAIMPKELELNLNLPISGGNTTITTLPDLKNPERTKVFTDRDLEYPLKNNNDGDQDDHLIEKTSMESVAKLNELKDMSNTNETSSSWLQVGIVSTTNMPPDP